MAIMCFFTNNGMPTSLLRCNLVGTFSAFSGQQQGRNNASLTSVPNIGPIPQGTYYIIDRPEGGMRSAIRDFALKYAYGTDRHEWFALYRRDGKMDDYTFIDGVRRGNFRLHPIGPRGLSEGCITLSHIPDFNYLRKRLLETSMISIPGSRLRAYGTIKVD